MKNEKKSSQNGAPEPKRQLPKPEQIRDFIRNSKTPVKRRDLAQAFGLKGAQRAWLRDLLRDMRDSGDIVFDEGRTVQLADALPRELTLRIDRVSGDGELVAVPIAEKLQNNPAHIVVQDLLDLKVGDHIDAILTEIEPGSFLAKVRRKLVGGTEKSVLGTYQPLGEKRGGHVFALDPDRVPRLYYLPPEETKGLKERMVVLAQPQGQAKAGQAPYASLIEIVKPEARGLESLIAIHRFDIPHVFPPEVMREAEALPSTLTDKEIAEREDLRNVPLVTIDGADARDFDDAVWAEPWDGNGYHIIVAIADVAQYIEEGGALDKEAFNRGNSTYFPDRVVPMLPERISNDLCSLRPHEDRPVLAVHMYIDHEGRLKKYHFVRAVIHSHGRLTYEQVQDALDGTPNALTAPLMDSTIKPLYGAYKLLLLARERRGAFDLDLPERSIIVGANGEIVKAGQRQRKDAHKLIEELMILANVATARALDQKKAPCMYRVHPEPTPEKLETLKGALETYNIRLPSTTSIRPEQYQHLAEKLKKQPTGDILLQLLLRSQSQAFYSPENTGHFGLNLTHYAHFTSPIRRYSDLVTHRSLIKNLKLAGKGGLKTPPTRLGAIAEHISITERRSQQAEWEAIDRFISRYYEGKIGEVFDATAISVLKFGMFVMIENGLGEGLVPLSSMGDERFNFDARKHVLIGQRSKRQFKVGDKFKVTLVEANQDVGQITFALGKVDPADFRRGRPNRGQHNKGGFRFGKKKEGDKAPGDKKHPHGGHHRPEGSNSGTSKRADKNRHFKRKNRGG